MDQFGKDFERAMKLGAAALFVLGLGIGMAIKALV